MKKKRLIAVHLPQFHPVPENDEWWGKGFTEWTNVVKAKPLYNGHYQPHLPADLGFYDLRLPEARLQQAALAKTHGIYGFCYYHYWFNGRRILDRPFQEIFESGQPDFPFMLCWANENWTRIWDGGENHILLHQQYGADDDRDHIRSLIPYFKDPRYIKIAGKPVFAIYKSSLLPDPASTIRLWREEALSVGLELYICRMEGFGDSGKKWMKGGFDAAIEFQPFADTLYSFRNSVLMPRLKRKLITRASIKWRQITGNKQKSEQLINKWFSRIDYNEYVDYVMANNLYPSEYKRFPGLTPSWDNTPRRGESGFLFRDANPTKYKEWLQFHYQNSGQ